MPEAVNKTVEIDVRGQICPSSLLTTLREVNKHKQLLRCGTLQLEILTDNHDSTNRICDAVGNMGYHVEVLDEDNYYRISIVKLAVKMGL
ncbi:TusA-related sulfurtransferase [Desulfuromusa kysingii]|uniref:TusA-related sulfurtransferase n=1 Tax=Desulfuromusa kysingii TaxID=37625 RepID=A0A1H3XPI7_9BACT|nr:sulfurtransferase TusA family protein [Desulfuromusa kysingii]SEA01273.1 TusA-related sulfurtransferase [Desulfuromusa kysingii]